MTRLVGGHRVNYVEGTPYPRLSTTNPTVGLPNLGLRFMAWVAPIISGVSARKSKKTWGLPPTPLFLLGLMAKHPIWVLPVRCREEWKSTQYTYRRILQDGWQDDEHGC